MERDGQTERRPIDQLDVAARVRERACYSPRASLLPGRERRRDIADRLVVALDPALADQPLGEVNRVVSEAQQLRGPAAEYRREQLWVTRNRRRQVARVARAGAPAAEFSFQQDHVGAACGERERRRHARVSPADHGHVAAHLPGHRRGEIVGRLDPAAEVEEVGMPAVHRFLKRRTRMTGNATSVERSRTEGKVSEPREAPGDQPSGCSVTCISSSRPWWGTPVHL